MPAKTSISGFPEWLPEERMIEQRLIETIKQQYELFGFAPIETRAVEQKDVLLGKGETSQEIYLLSRLQAREDEPESDMGLHFDLTVPFSRYLLENRGSLSFPFRRYQIQKVWRGERASSGRFREFYQADFDVIAENNLSIHADAEMVQVMHAATTALPIPPVIIRFNNRKVLEGFYQALGIENFEKVLTCVDKLDKIGSDGVMSMLEESDISHEKALKCLDIAKINGSTLSVIQDIQDLGLNSSLLEQGLEEMTYVLRATQHIPGNLVTADLSIARGLNYYTGTVAEGIMQGMEGSGSVCGGGRYDNLASQGNFKFPGVGASIGVTRIMSQMLEHGLLSCSRKTPACVYVALVSEAMRHQSDAVAQALRARGIACEVADTAPKFGKQIKIADKKGIPFVWFPSLEPGQGHSIKDIRNGDQQDVSPTKWMPPEQDRQVRIIKNEKAWEKLGLDSVLKR